jgi:hypothetical protein
MDKKNSIDELPKNFRSVISDFSIDLSTTFPEYSYYWSKWTDPEVSDDELLTLFTYCKKIYPERFFDILYQNEDIFKPDNDTNVYFLPNVSFRLLFNCENVSETTRKALWKYLQLMLFTVVGGINDKSNFGDTMNLFDGIDETELQQKLSETMSGLTDFFKSMETDAGANAYAGADAGADASSYADANASTDANAGSNANTNKFAEGFQNMFNDMPNAEEFKKTFKMDGMPDISKFQEHLKTLFDGKIGSLAKEMAEEIADEFKDILGKNTENMTSTKDVIQQLMKNPAKIMQLMKKVGSKLDSKMKSGEFSREDLMKEASELMSKMKDMGGQDEFNEMFKNLTKNMGGLGKNMKLDTNALNRMSQQAATRERIKKKLEAKQQADIEKAKANFTLNSTATPNNLVFKLDGAETQEKSFIHPDLIAEMNAPPSDKKKKKNKNKK